MQTDIEIAQAATVKPITEIAAAAGLASHEIELPVRGSIWTGSR